MSNIFITGASGFLGSQLALKLANEDHRVVCLVKDKNFRLRKDLVDKVTIVYGDLRDYEAVRYCISRYEIDHVFHLAATTIIKQAVIDPITTYQSNVMGTCNVLEASRQVGNRIKKIVVASSDKAYGNAPVLPYTEEMPVTATDPYSTSKACTDLISKSFADTYDMNISVVRAGNLYGGGDINFSRLVPGSICRLLKGESPTIYKGVGEFRREWVYIDDIISAYMVVAERGGAGEAYNVGGSGFHSIFDTVDIIIKACNSNIKPTIIDKDFIEIKEQWLDATKLQALGWECKFNLEDGLARTVDWYSDYMENKSKLYFGNGG